jgi:hypothetical protein
MMNLGDGECQIVEFSPALPNQGAFFLYSATDDASRDELRPLRDAIAAAVWNSQEVMNAMDMLKRRGLDVQFEIDAIVLDSASGEHISTPAEAALAARGKTLPLV